MNNNYWEKFWNENDILGSENLQNQIGRAINKEPISEELWIKTLSYIFNTIEITRKDVVLDLCAGNGLITLPLSEKVKRVVAVDVSKKLISTLNDNKKRNTTLIIENILKLECEENSFSKIIFYFAIQHFTEGEVIFLFKKVNSWLTKGGIFYIGDIPDIERLFHFFNTKEREFAYFNSQEKNTPIIGTWFNRRFMEKLALYSGFSSIEIIKQPNYLINSHYRFDVKLIK